MIAQAREWPSNRSRGLPALAVMTDLTQVKAATTSPSTSLRQAEQMMITLGVRMLLVASDMPAIRGLVTTTDLHGDRQMRGFQQRRYDELTVADVMSGLPDLDAIDYEVMKTALVGDLIATLQRFGRNHLLVIEGPTENTPPRVRGVISRAQIERQLGSPVPVTEAADTFAEVARMLSWAIRTR
jgi:CBS domain-containing protein